MQWKLDLNKQYKETTVTIQGPEWTENVRKLTMFIDQIAQKIVVNKNNEFIEIDLKQIIYIENMERTTFVYTSKEIYELDSPLYKLEIKLSKFGFIRINKQTILNPRSIKSVKALLNSRLELLLMSGEKLIVTRRYQRKFKSLFSQGGFYDA